MFNVYHLCHIITPYGIYYYVRVHDDILLYILYRYAVVSFPDGRHRHFLTKYYCVCRSQLQHSDDGGFFCPLELCYHIRISNSERCPGVVVHWCY